MQVCRHDHSISGTVSRREIAIMLWQWVRNPLRRVHTPPDLLPRGIDPPRISDRSSLLQIRQSPNGSRWSAPQASCPIVGVQPQMAPNPASKGVDPAPHGWSCQPSLNPPRQNTNKYMKCGEELAGQCLIYDCQLQGNARNARKKIPMKLSETCYWCILWRSVTDVTGASGCRNALDGAGTPMVLKPGA